MAPLLQRWLREASSSDNIDSLVQRCHVAANRIDSLERALAEIHLVNTPAPQLSSSTLLTANLKRMLRWK